MRLDKRLTVAGADAPLVSEDIRLDLSTPGRAVFQVRSETELSGLARYELGYAGQDDVVYFLGYVEASHTVDGARQRLLCRELSAGLYGLLPISLRHPTLQDVLAAYADLTGLEFVTPDAPYVKRRVPYFQTLGKGFQGMTALGDLFGVEDLIWQQQGDGRIFVGSWSDSRWADRPVELDEKWFSKVGADGGKRLPVLPLLRPGAVVNGRRLLRVQLSGHEMVVQWRDYA